MENKYVFRLYVLVQPDTLLSSSTSILYNNRFTEIFFSGAYRFIMNLYTK